MLEWDFAWSAVPTHRSKGSEESLRKVARLAEQSVLPDGFRLFQNGGRPLLERHRGDYREEIVLIPAPQMYLRSELPFTVQVHLSSKAIARVRSRFWRPAIRAPEIVASGNLGLLCSPPGYLIFSAFDQYKCAERLSDLLVEVALPWFKIFRSRTRLRDHLYEGPVPLVSGSTTIELMLTEYGLAEAREFMDAMNFALPEPAGPISELEGYDLASNRFGPIKAYYKL
jgi:hypothetical protein